MPLESGLQQSDEKKEITEAPARKDSLADLSAPTNEYPQSGTSVLKRDQKRTEVQKIKLVRFPSLELASIIEITPRPTPMTWCVIQCPGTPTARCWHAAQVLEGKMYIFCGVFVNNSKQLFGLNDIHSFDFASMKWKQVKITEPKIPCCWALQSTVCSDGVYFIGGRNAAHEIFNTLYLFKKNEVLQIVSTKNSPSVCAGGLSTIEIKGSPRLVLTCGIDKFAKSEQMKPHNTNAIRVLDLTTRSWETFRTQLPERAWHSQCSANNKVYIYGGMNSNNEVLDDFWMLEYDSTSHAFIASEVKCFGNIPPKMHSASLVYWRENELFLFGGGIPFQKDTFNYYYIFNTETLQWSRQCGLGVGTPHALSGQSACVNPSQSFFPLYIFGGQDLRRQYHNTLYLLDFGENLKNLPKFSLTNEKANSSTVRRFSTIKVSEPKKLTTPTEKPLMATVKPPKRPLKIAKVPLKSPVSSQTQTTKSNSEDRTQNSTSKITVKSKTTISIQSQSEVARPNLPRISTPMHTKIRSSHSDVPERTKIATDEVVEKPKNITKPKVQTKPLNRTNSSENELSRTSPRPLEPKYRLVSARSKYNKTGQWQSRYEIVERIGKGGFSAIYLAKSKENQEQVVLKMSQLDKLDHDSVVFVKEEIEIIGSLPFHPCLIQLREAFLSTERAVLVLNYCEKGDLYTVLEKMRSQHRRLLEDQIRSWFTQILMALQHIHRCGYIHGDVKSSNILFTDDWRVQLADFGLAVRTEQSVQTIARMQHRKECNGTPQYMAPELFRSQPPSTGSDCWAVGIVLFEMASLDCPFNLSENETNLSLLADMIARKPCGHIPAEYSVELDNIVQSLLAKRPNLRPSITTLLKHPICFPIFQDFMKRYAGIENADPAN